MVEYKTGYYLAVMDEADFFRRVGTQANGETFKYSFTGGEGVYCKICEADFGVGSKTRAECEAFAAQFGIDVDMIYPWQRTVDQDLTEDDLEETCEHPNKGERGATRCGYRDWYNKHKTR